MQFTEHIPGHVYDQLLRGLEEYAGGRNRCGRAARTSAHPCRHAARRRHGGTRRRASRLQPRERWAGTSRRPCRLSSLIAIRLGHRIIGKSGYTSGGRHGSTQVRWVDTPAAPCFGNPAAVSNDARRGRQHVLPGILLCVSVSSAATILERWKCWRSNVPGSRRSCWPL
jgi:hypothetical protein